MEKPQDFKKRSQCIETVYWEEVHSSLFEGAEGVFISNDCLLY